MHGTLIEDVLNLAQEKCFGVKKPEEHNQRKPRIRENVKMLELARVRMGKQPYENMRWPLEKMHAEHLIYCFQESLQS